MVLKRRTQALPQCVGSLRVLVSNNIVSLQPNSLCQQSHTPGKAPAAALPIPTLNLDLKSGHVSISWVAPISEDSPVALGVLGMFQLGAGSVLVIITKATQVILTFCCCVSCRSIPPNQVNTEKSLRSDRMKLVGELTLTCCSILKC